MSPRRLAPLGAAAVIAAFGAAPAHGSTVLVVNGDRAVQREDPLVPARAGSDVGLPPRAAPRQSRARARTRNRARSARAPKGRRATLRALREALLRGDIDAGSYNRYRRVYLRARTVRRRLRRGRRRQLGYVITSLDRMALRGRLIPSRMPAVFLQVRRNLQYWPRLPYPRPGDRVSFRGSEILFQFYRGRGLQIQPLATFKKANLMHGACTKKLAAPCRPAGLGRLIDEMSAIAARRSSGFIAWEYLFHFGGGSPPWMSGMAQATGIQALARASKLLERPSYLVTAREALGAFEAGPPVGVRTRGPRGGIHYLQYSFARRLYIFNAFLQALIGLHDYGVITNDERALNLFDAAEPEAGREIPYSDTGSWSRYSYRGRKSTPEYHELLREFLQSMCNRRLGEVYCKYARRYREYQLNKAR